MFDQGEKKKLLGDVWLEVLVQRTNYSEPSL